MMCSSYLTIAEKEKVLSIPTYILTSWHPFALALQLTACIRSRRASCSVSLFTAEEVSLILRYIFYEMWWLAGWLAGIIPIRCKRNLEPQHCKGEEFGRVAIQPRDFYYHPLPARCRHPPPAYIFSIFHFR